MRLVDRGLLACLFLLALPAATMQAAEEETREVTAQDLTLTVPKSWKQQQASNNLRLAQFAIEPVAGDEEPAELAIFPPFGGTVSENVKRWIDQFQADDRQVQMTQGEASQGKYVLVDLNGTYNKPDGPPVLRKTKPVSGYRMVAVILTSSKGGNYFLKLTGPKKTVDAALDAFRKSFGADASKETRYDL